MSASPIVQIAGSNGVFYVPSLSASNHSALYTFVAPASGYLQSICLYFDDVSSGAASYYLYAADSNGNPTGAAIESGSLTISSYAAVVTNLAGTSSLTAGTAYCIKIVRTAGSFNPAIQSSRLTPAYGRWSTDGSTWQARALGRASGAFINVKIGGTWYGSRFGRNQGVALTSYPIYNTGSSVRRLGALCTPVASGKLASVGGTFYKQGSPTGYLKAELYSGASLVATSNSYFDASLLDSYSWTTKAVEFDFAGYDVSASSNYRCVFLFDGTTGNDASNYVVCSGHNPCPSTSWPSTPDDGILGGTYATVPSISSESDFTDSTTSSGMIPSLALYGYASAAASGGGGLVGPSALVN